MAEINVKNDTYESEVLNSTIPVLVDFWAPWCGPCKQMLPLVEELANEFDGKIKVCKINVDDNIELAQKNRVASIPAFLVFKDGQVADRRVGSCSKAEMIAFLQKNM